MIDACFVSEKFCLVAADILSQRARRIATARQCRARGVELASVDMSERFMTDKRKFRPFIGKSGKLCSQADQLISRGIEAGGNLVIRDSGFAQLFEDRAQRRDLNPFLARDLRRQPRKFFRNRPLRLSDLSPDLFLVEPDLVATDDVTTNRADRARDVHPATLTLGLPI
jgi:hypothetical protein